MTVPSDNAKHFPNDAVWQEHCARVAAYLEYVAKTGKEPTLSLETEAQVERAMRRYERRGRTEWVNDGNGRGWQHQINIVDWAGQ